MELSVGPFVHWSAYNIAICKVCKAACVADEALSHLNRKHQTIPPREREGIAAAVGQWPSIIRNQAELRQFALPATIDPIPYIAAPQTDGLKCKQCGYISRSVRKIQGHCRQTHGWVNEWKKGGNVAKRSKQERVVPWITGVRCQRLFQSRVCSGWFEVGSANEVSGQLLEQLETADQTVERFKQLHREQAARFEAAGKELIRVADVKKEQHAWVERAGWAEHLQGLAPDKMRAAAGSIEEDEVVLQRMWESLERVLDQARATATASKVGLATLFEIERKSIHIKPRRPFDNRLEDSTWVRYKEVWQKLLCIWQRTQEWDDEERPPYRMTVRQGDLYDAFAAAAEKVVDDMETVAEETLDRLCLDMVVGLLDHQYKQGHYDNIIISGLAVMGIRDDGGWVDATDYTSIYSAVIKVARMLVVYQSFLEREDEVEQLKSTMDEEDARDEAAGIFSIVRSKVRRFMTLVSDRDTAQPSPMDWIFDTRTYGMHIQFTTPASGSIDWQGDRIVYRAIRFSMGQLSDMLHVLVGEARALLTQLAMVEVDDTQALPKIEWAGIEDDHSEERIGYSFLQDARNAWVIKGKDWVLRRIIESRQKREEWMSSGTDGTSPYNVRAVRAYGQMVEKFRELLWMLMHMVAGQPARTTEMMWIRLVNTVNGGLRNIFAHNRMMCFATSYHKGYRNTGQAKVIHRYLPREIGELLVWYMWLILGFWQEVQGIIKDADRRSPFLWADEIVSRAEDVGKEGHEQGGEVQEVEGREEQDQGNEVSMAETDGYNEWIQERKWTSDRLRRILQSHSERLMGHKLNISAWRHIAIAIANRYLNKAFGESGQYGEGGDEDEDEDGIDDNVWDLQAGHGTHVAGMVYAREIQQGVFSTATRRDRFRVISRQWHRFLGFGADDCHGVKPGAKRVRDAFEGAREEARFRRFKRLRQVDIHGRLKQMMGEEVDFRGTQEAVIRAIICGESPIVQITGTGGGKSLSFMLPAFCSPDGVTIVIVPLVSLRGDLYNRCMKSGIEAHVWQSRQGNWAASIVFVTPESAVTKGFREFVNRLQARQELDRVVVDECHVVPDGNHGFRPQMQELGRLLRELGVQLVFLTATLAPRNEAEFFTVLGLTAGRVRMFRSRTTRKNIEYKVTVIKTDRKKQEKEEDEQVCRVVTRWMDGNGSDKVIVYGGSIERVERLGEMLSCETYHSKVDTTKGKEKRLKEWIGGGRLIVATSALGLGVDVPNVRLVVHAGMPRRLRDYVQESGRAGRDGCRSEAVVVCGEIKVRSEAEDEDKKGQGWEEEVKEYVEGKSCRRVVLDSVMDGWTQRSGCEEGEEACDICTGRQWEAVADEGEEEGLTEVGEERTNIEIEEDFDRQRRQGQFERWKVEREAMDEGEEVEEFRRQLESWVGCCAVCRLAGESDVYHEMEDCPQRNGEKWATIELGIETMEREMFVKKRFEPFSGCFYCGLPQAMCDKWREVGGDGGRFAFVRGGQCQYSGLVAKVYAGVFAYFEDEAEEVMKEKMSKDGLDGEIGVGWYKWLGGRIKWGGLETNRFCRGFFWLCKITDELRKYQGLEDARLDGRIR